MTKQEEVQIWLDKIRANPRILDSSHPDIARFWRNQANIEQVKVVKKNPVQIYLKDNGVCIDINWDLLLETTRKKAVA